MHEDHMVYFSRFTRTVTASALLPLALGFTSLPTHAAGLTVKQARAAIAPFYDGLNAAPGKDIPAILMKATAPEWVSCGGNDQCGPRDKVIPGIVGLHQAVPNLKWVIKDVLVSGDKVIVRGEATGTPAGEFLGVPNSGKSLTMMSIDIHTIKDGKIVRSYHVEDLMGAAGQLRAK
jgi:SnoaL-like polyketide cyclase